MKVKLTEAGKRIAETLEIPKAVREKFYSLFRKTAEIDQVFLRWDNIKLNVSNLDEDMCKAIMLLPRPYAHIEVIQKEDAQEQSNSV